MQKYNISPDKILVIQTAFIGDVILSTGFLRELKRVFPNAIIDFVTTPIASTMFGNSPYLRNIYPYNKKGIKGFFETRKLVKALKKEKYDIAFSLHLSTRSSLIMKKAKIPIRVGNPKMKFLTHPIPVEKGLHMIERYIGILKPFTNLDLDSSTELHFNQQQNEKIKSIINNNESLKIGIAPGSVRITKKWPLEYFRELVLELEKLNISIFMIGGKEDFSASKDIILNVKSAINCCGELSLLESACLIKEMDLMITNDSSPLHMANAVKTDLISFFGPTVKEFGCYPYRKNDVLLEVDLPCRPCGKHGGNNCPEGHFKCMKDIKPCIVLTEIKRKLKV